MIPANPKTYVVSIQPGSSEGYVKEPIVAWAPDPKEPMAQPIPLTMHGQRRLLTEDGILFPCGMVSAPLGDLSYGSVEEWLEAGPAKKRQSAPKPAKPTVAQERDEEVMGEGVYDIEWTDNTYKSNSFWHYDDGEYEFVFLVEGGYGYPKATSKCVKIKRDEFMAMKKNVDALTVEDIQNADPLPVGEDDDDEDDGMDLL